ncbi:hypothetical protein [Streptococcus oralis]|uniref:hypothetical protein n=1 Tax=Streptococcus oralis TaxID=1303 RepID=UPI00189FA7F2|nr:hypothetical protein [Streptococcus oralis]
MSLNKTRKRLIRKYRKLFNSYPIGIKISTDGGNTFSAMGRVFETFIPDASVVKSGNINASKLQSGEISFRNFEITISQGFTKEEFNKLNGGVL